MLKLIPEKTGRAIAMDETLETNSSSEDEFDCDYTRSAADKVRKNWRKNISQEEMSTAVCPEKSTLSSGIKSKAVEGQFDDENDFMPEKKSRSAVITLVPTIGPKFDMIVSSENTVADVKNYINKVMPIDLLNKEIKVYQGKNLLADSTNLFNVKVQDSKRLNFMITSKPGQFKTPQSSLKVAPRLSGENLQKKESAAEVIKKSVILKTGRNKLSRKASKQLPSCLTSFKAPVLPNSTGVVKLGLTGVVKSRLTGMVRPCSAGMAKPSSSEVVGPSSSGVLGTRSPGVLGTRSPGVLGTRSPGVLGTSSSGVLGTSSSGVLGTSSSGVLGTRSPGGLGTSSSGVLGTRSPGVLGTRSPGVLGTRSPGVLGTSSSGVLETSSSGVLGTRSPGGLGTSSPGVLGTSSPGVPLTRSSGVPGTSSSRVLKTSSAVVVKPRSAGVVKPGTEDVMKSAFLEEAKGRGDFIDHSINASETLNNDNPVCNIVDTPGCSVDEILVESCKYTEEGIKVSAVGTSVREKDMSEDLVLQYSKGLTKKPAPIKRAIDFFKSEKVKELMSKKSINASAALILSNKCWKKLDESKRLPYQEMENRDKIRHQKEQNEYRRKVAVEDKKKKLRLSKGQTFNITETNQDIPDFDLQNHKEPEGRRSKKVKVIPMDEGVDCKECLNCVKVEDCGHCVDCLDKKKFGGSGRRKRKCKERVCVFKVPKSAPVRCPCDVCIKENCGSCHNCKTRPEFGGLKHNKQKCVEKKKNCHIYCYKCKEKHTHLMCCKCSVTFNTREEKLDHSCQFKCNVCPASFPTKQGVERHKNSHLNDNIKKKAPQVKRFICDICGSKFLTNYKLNRHKTTVHDKIRVKFPCELCPKSFSKQTLLEDHLSWHKNENKYICPFCNKQLKNRETYNIHTCLLRNDLDMLGDNSDEDTNSNDDERAPSNENNNKEALEKKEALENVENKDEGSDKQEMDFVTQSNENKNKDTSDSDSDSQEIDSDIEDSKSENPEILFHLKKRIKEMEKKGWSSRGDAIVLKNLKEELSRARQIWSPANEN